MFSYEKIDTRKKTKSLCFLVVMSSYVRGKWCPEEDVALSKLSSKNRVLRGDQLSKVVPKAVRE